MPELIEILANKLNKANKELKGREKSDVLLSRMKQTDRLPPLSLIDLGEMAANLAIRILKSVEILDVNKSDFPMECEHFIQIVNDLSINLIPFIIDKVESDLSDFESNLEILLAINSYTSTLQHISMSLDNHLSWSTLEDANALPTEMVQKLKYLQRQIAAIDIDHSELSEKIELINNTADRLTNDLKDAEEAKEKILNIKESAHEDYNNVQGKSKDSDKIHKKLQQLQDEAIKIIKHCDEAMSSSTSINLGSAFLTKANKLKCSLKGWIVALSVGLAGMGTIGYFRLESMSSVITKQDAGLIFVHILISLMAVGVPAWLAWLSTKQINQSVRLIEDYSYKAALSFAYEGYRKEANRYGEEMAESLLKSNLSHLNDSPLRLMENVSHSSPLMEFLSKPKIQRETKEAPHPDKEASKNIFNTSTQPNVTQEDIEKAKATSNTDTEQQESS